MSQLAPTHEPSRGEPGLEEAPAALAMTDERAELLGWLRRFGRACQRSRRAYFLAFLLTWMGMIWLLSSISGPQTGTRRMWVVVIANLVHAPLFGMLAFAVLPLLPRREDCWPRLSRLDRTLVALGVLAYAWIDEWHQSFVPERTASSLDMLTDLVGAVCVLWIATYLGRSQATTRGLNLRLALGVLACLGAAVLSSFGPPSW